MPDSTLFPPAIVGKEYSAEALIVKAKLAFSGTVKSAIEAGRLLSEAKAMCIHGDWLNLLKEQDLADRTARWLMKKFRDNQKEPIADLEAFLAEDKDAKPKKKKADPDDPSTLKAKMDILVKKIQLVIGAYGHHMHEKSYEALRQEFFHFREIWGRYK